MEIERINEAIREQESNYNELTRILTNLKKDSAARKTRQYIEERRQGLLDVHNRALARHRELSNQEVLDSHRYITANYFDNNIQKTYDDAIELLETYEDMLEATHDKGVPSGKTGTGRQDDNEGDARIFVQLFRVNQLTKKLRNIQEAFAKHASKGHLQVLSKALQEQWQAIELAHIELLSDKKTYKHTYFTEGRYDEIQRDYDSTVEQLHEEVWGNSFPVSAPTRPTAKLPQIKIPVFSGTYELWSTFRDLFTKIIHEDTSISCTEKMQYLKSHVQGNAAKVIQYLPISEVNYNTAWELLNKRYDNKREIVNKFIDKLLDLPKTVKPSHEQLRDMHDTIKECLEMIKNQGIDTRSWGPFLCRILSRKWDSETNNKYEESLDDGAEVQEFHEMLKFLEKRFKSIGTGYERSATVGATSTNLGRKEFQKLPQGQIAQLERRKQCWYCDSNDHTINHCSRFESLHVNERNKIVNNKEMCRRCLNHSAAKQCRSEKYKNCEKCQRADHSTLLHRNYITGQNVNTAYKQARENFNDRAQERNTAKPTGTNKFSSNISGVTESGNRAILLATALVKTMTFDGMPQLVRVLCDQGSEASFCTEEVAQLLSYPKTKIQAEIKGIGDDKPKRSKYSIDIVLQPRHASTYRLPVSLIVLPKLTSSLPRNDLPQIQQQDLQNKVIADPTYYKKGPVDIILGAQEYSKILLQGLEKLDDGIIAQNTELGWILSGFFPAYTKDEVKVVNMTIRTEEVQQLTRFWELEEIQETDSLSKEDKECEEYFRETTTRNTDGTYTVRLPFKNKSLELGESRKKAVARLLQLEKQFGKNEKLRQQYHQFMKEYDQMGHMKKVSQQDINKGKYYIPHQAVIREESLTTKLRAVFDASSKTDRKVSLNDNLLKGHRLQQDLSDILVRWRMHKIAFMSDIMKMYRCIKMHPDDLKYQRILWRCSPKQPIDEYELTTVTYGTTCAPYLAVRTLQQLALDEQKRYPMASKVAMQDFYVDDILGGAMDIETAKTLQIQLIQMLKKGGFLLRKWSSNSEEFLGNIPDDSEDQLLKLPWDEDRKSLGIAWTPSEDKFYFQIKITENSKPTKRFILAEVAKIFDPLGWLAPVIITMKLLVQELWTDNMQWDQIVDEQIKKRWVEIQSNLKQIEDIKISRWCQVSNLQEIELHGFSDASEKAYGAVVYCRTKVKDVYQVTLLQAKSKVAPKKHKTTIPRLELCSAMLLVKLMKKIQKALNIAQAPVYCWTDSMITLGWIRGEAGRWKTFVSNRVSEIQRLLPNAHWNHVVSAENPADIVSRGVEPQKLKAIKIWWDGPEWLQQDHLPTTKTLPEPCIEVHSFIGMAKKEQVENNIWSRFSSFEHMIRVLSYCCRFTKKPRLKGTISIEEIKNTTTRVIRQVQNEAFQEDLNMLRREHAVKRSSRLAALDPFIDADGVIRVGGRLQNSELSYDQKHPVILPYDHYVTTMVVRNAHLKTLHGGNNLTLAYVRRSYWIIGGKKKVKAVINQCVKCIRYKAETASQKMGILPKQRVTQSHAFSHSGVDYAGPIQIRGTKGRGHKSYKAYIAVFVCLATKAIHLELVGDLSTESFIAALRRFMARRGHVSHMYSDNATNFVGAANCLHEEILQITQSQHFENAITNMGTKWHFIPAASPHAGGIWEAGVRSMKHHLRRVIGVNILTYEEMNTFLHQVEACLNSRPLCPLNEDINDSTILTPSHFLIGREAVGIPDPIDNVNTDYTNRWKLIQRMKRDIWKSWTKEYLHQLQQRYKWKNNQENLKVGTAVIIKEENISPSRWPLAKVKEIHPGPDNMTRVVTLQKANRKCTKRAIHNLIPLPVHEENAQNTNSKQNTITNNVATVSPALKSKEKTKNSKRLGWLSIALMVMLQLTVTTNAETLSTYKLKKIDPGLYIEEIGKATIDRGTFRIETTFKKQRMLQDYDIITKATEQVKALCNKAQEIMYDTHCNEFYHHLTEEKSKFERTIQYLTEVTHARRRRGLLGQMLTSIFGVNDEVYKDINTLQDNQKRLIEATNQQTQFMISTITTVNQTEETIHKKLDRFQEKLNQAIKVINNNNVWYKTVDENHVKIQVMQTYHLANNYITEVMDHYAGILEIYLENASIYSRGDRGALGSREVRAPPCKSGRMKGT